ncbi:MAG: hypothetical protein DSO04_02190 [Hadesarchaea archaeon]|nr:MAG: hypothetical protein DSO04_02190 [Hadesarchaea archaeon]
MAEREVPQTGAQERRDAKWYVQRFAEADRELSAAGIAWLTAETRVSVCLGIVRELARDARMAEARERRRAEREEPATEAQLQLLQKLGVRPDRQLTRSEASRLIDALKRP